MAEDFSFKASIDVGVNNSQKAVGDINAIVKQLELLNKTAAKSLDELTSLNEKGLGRTTKAAKETETATKQLNKAQEDQTKNLPRLRYALYDVSSTMAGLSAATLGGIAATLTFSASFEKAFTAVERTTMASGDALDLLRTQLLKLASEVPIAFQDLSQIAALGSQLGIASNDLIGFTKTVSEFAATTNVSVDEAGKSFGRLGELLDVTPDKYRNLASAVSLVGVSSAATETEILRTSTGLAGVAKTAGLSTEFIIGLAGSLASLGIPAEQSRGALTRIFQEINRAAAQGGPTLDAFAQVLGKTTAETKNLAQSNLEGFFQQLITGLSGLDAGQLTSTLDAINLADIRVTNTLSRLAKNQQFTNDLINQASAEYKTGAYLGFAYSKTVDDLASKFQILQNSLSILGANIGDAIAPVAKDVLNVIIDLVNGLSAMAKTPAGQTLVTVNAIFAVLVGTVASLVGTLALAGASIAATRTALNELGISAGVADVAVKGLSTSMKWFMGIGILLTLGEIITGMVGMKQAAEDANAAFTNMIGDTTGLAEAVAADTQAHADAVAAGNQTVADSYVNLGVAAAETNPELQAYQDNLRTTADVLGVTMPSAFDAVNGAIQSNTAYLGENTIAWVKNALMANQSFQELMSGPAMSQNWIEYALDAISGVETLRAGAQESLGVLLNQTALNYDTLIRITSAQGYEAGRAYFIKMVEGAASLSGAAKSALIARVEDIVRPIAGLGSTILQLGNTMSTTMPSLNTFNSGIKDLGKNSADTAKKVRTLVDYANDLGGVMSRAFDIRWQSMLDADKTADSWASLSDRIQSAKDKILGLTATRGKLEYFLSIAVKAGDQVRIAELQSELAKTSQDLADATDEAAASLNADTVVGRKNRRELLNIIQSNQDYIKSLAAEGASKAKLRAETARLRQEFVAQAQAMGFSSTEINKMAQTFNDMATIVSKVPRKITVAANTDPALQALAELKAKARDTIDSINTMKSPTISTSFDVDTTQARKTMQGMIDAYKAALALERKRLIPNKATIDTLVANINALSEMIKGFASGGYTGRGGKYQPAGIVHKGEYVIPKEQVNQATGLPYADALGRAMPASAPAAPGYANGGLVGAGSMMVSLSPDDRALLRAVGGSGDIVVAVDSREIARANAKGAKLVTAEGGYLV